MAPRGGAPVGFLSEIEGIERLSVEYLRLWCASRETQQDAINRLTRTLGADRAAHATEQLRQICDLFSRHGRRPLMRHQVGCSCLGADEACFANFIAAAATGQREDALLFAILIVRPDFGPALACLGEQFGLALMSETHGFVQEAHRPMDAVLH